MAGLPLLASLSCLSDSFYRFLLILLYSKVVAIVLLNTKSLNCRMRLRCRPEHLLYSGYIFLFNHSETFLLGIISFVKTIPSKFFVQSEFTARYPNGRQLTFCLSHCPLLSIFRKSRKQLS